LVDISCAQKEKGHMLKHVALSWIGAADRNRTGDLRITNALLYRLSYSGETWLSPAAVQRKPDW
jgi:hypothetical protein